MSTDLIEIKPGAFGVRINVNEIWRRLRCKHSPASQVVRRFLDLFQAHGIAHPQIQRFLPQITLENLAPDQLAAVLTNETIDQAATLFGVRREWLEGTDQQIYEPRYCYKVPRRFFQDLAQWQINLEAFSVRALHCGDLDNTSSREQTVVLIVVEPIAKVGDKEICRYRIYHDAWDWGHLPCRLQLKATARLIHLGWQTPVPLYRVQQRVLERICAGKRVPRFEVKGCLLTEPSLEDYALGENESGKAQETEELGLVLRYFEYHQLADLFPETRVGLL